MSGGQRIHDSWMIEEQAKAKDIDPVGISN